MLALDECGLKNSWSLNPLKRVKFISILNDGKFIISLYGKSQSPQTGQVYFNAHCTVKCYSTRDGLNPLKRVKFISIEHSYIWDSKDVNSLNPLKRVKFISIQSDSVSLFFHRISSQSPQTGQVYFNLAISWTICGSQL